MTRQKLNPEFKTKWIAALRSGEYEQGKGFLLRNGKYCCMGIACVVAGVDPRDIGSDKEVGAWFSESCPVLQPLRGPSILTLASTPVILSSMNDVDGKSFDEIADWIEENL